MMKFIILAAASLLSAGPSAADVKLANAHGFMIENSQQAHASQATVFNALVDDVDQWWPKDHSWWRGTFSITPQAGGCFCETDGNKQAQHMQIVRLAPPSTLVMEGGLGPLQQMGVSGALTWSLSPTDEAGNTTVTLSYNVHGISATGFEKLAAIVDEVQASQLRALTDHVSMPTVSRD